jgi:type IV secretory pathway VirD2 relaxase
MQETRDELSLSVILRRPAHRREPRRLPRGRSPGDRNQRAPSARRPARAVGFAVGSGVRSQRSAVKVAYMPAGTRNAWRAHGAYLAREGAQQEGAKGLGFDAARDDLDVARTLGAWHDAGDRLLWKAIVSPEQAARLDLRAHARELVVAMERDLGTRLEWVGIDHHNTDHPHLHLLIRGRGGNGRPLTLDAQYVQRGIRLRSEDLVTRSLGLRTDRHIAARQEQAIGRAQFTDLDRAILARANGNREVSYGDPAPAGQAPRTRQLLEMRRLDFLGTLGLAERVGPRTWTLSPHVESTLRQTQLARDILKSRARHQVPLSDPRIPLVVTPLAPGLRLEGRVVGMGVADAGQKRPYLLLEGTDRRLHYVLQPPGPARAWDVGRLHVGDRIILVAGTTDHDGPAMRDSRGSKLPAQPGPIELVTDRAGRAAESPLLPTLAALQAERGRPIRVVPPLDGLIYRGGFLGYARDHQGQRYAVVDTGRDLAAFRTDDVMLAAGREVHVTGHAVRDGRHSGYAWRLRGAEQAQERVR